MVAMRLIRLWYDGKTSYILCLIKALQTLPSAPRPRRGFENSTQLLKQLPINSPPRSEITKPSILNPFSLSSLV